MKKFFAAVLLICMVLTLCACDGGEKISTQPNENQPQTTQPQATQPQATQPQATQPQETEPQETQPQGKTYTIKVVDEGGNPVENVMVQLCSDSGCMPKMTNAEGVAVYENQPEISGYKASVTMYPEGYEAAGEQVDFYFESAYEVTITVKAVA